MLFDSLLWAARAARSMTPSSSHSSKGRPSALFAQLLTEVLETSEGRDFVLDRECTAEILGPSLVEPLRGFFDELDGETLATFLVGGVLKADLHPRSASSLKWDTLRADDFLLAPLPNHLFQRDSSCWIYGGVSANPMARLARQRETLHTKAIYRYHPMFAGEDFITYYGGDDANHLPASVEGGDVHVIGNGTVMIGMGERTTPMGAEMLTACTPRLGTSEQDHRRRTTEDPIDDASRHRDDDDRPHDLCPLPVLRPRGPLLDHHGRRSRPLQPATQREPLGNARNRARGRPGDDPHHGRGVRPPSASSGTTGPTISP